MTNSESTPEEPISAELREELDRRLAAMKRNPDSGDTWKGVKAAILHSHRTKRGNMGRASRMLPQ